MFVLLNLRHPFLLPLTEEHRIWPFAEPHQWILWFWLQHIFTVKNQKVSFCPLRAKETRFFIWRLGWWNNVVRLCSQKWLAEIKGKSSWFYLSTPLSLGDLCCHGDTNNHMVNVWKQSPESDQHGLSVDCLVDPSLSPTPPAAILDIPVTQKPIIYPIRNKTYTRNPCLYVQIMYYF